MSLNFWIDDILSLKLTETSTYLCIWYSITVDKNISFDAYRSLPPQS